MLNSKNMQELFAKYYQLLKARIDYNNGFTNFGEDSVRYDFYFALQDQYSLAPHELMLEQEIPNTQYVQRENVGTPRGGRTTEKPEIDLMVHPTESLPAGLVVEFAYFRKPPIADNSAKTANHGKLMQDIFRLAMLKEHESYSNYKHLMVCLMDSEMLEYGSPGTRGRSAIGIQEEYNLSTQFLERFPKTAIKPIDSVGFRKKSEEIHIVPRAERVFNAEHPETSGISKWALMVWDVGFTSGKSK